MLARQAKPNLSCEASGTPTGQTRQGRPRLQPRPHPDPKIHGEQARGNIRAEPDPIRVVRWLLGDGRSGGGFEGDLVAEDLQLADVVALSAFGTDAGVVDANAAAADLA